MAIRSSAMASAVRNTFSDTGTLSPSMESMQTANAISVAVGIPHPDAASVPWLITV
ncbi:unknown [Bacteroides sp. CAG:1060]|nr:unknown [Bacteroides sp. CAG:1060]